MNSVSPIGRIIFATLLFSLTFMSKLMAQGVTSKDTICCPTWYYDDVLPEYIESGFHTAIFSDNVNVRQAPSLTSSVLAVLPIGQPVQVLAFDTTRLTINGRTACWHQVSWSNTAKKQEQGWVWGGYLSLAGGGCKEEPMFLIGCTEVKKIPGSRKVEYVHEVKAVKDFKLINKIKLPEVSVGEAQVYGIRIQTSRGLPNVLHVLQFYWSSATCGGLQQDFFALWTQDQQFQVLPPVKSMGEAGFYTQIEKYIFPDEIEDLKYTYPLMYLYAKPENKTAILYYKEDSGGDEDGASITISINKLKFEHGIWRK